MSKYIRWWGIGAYFIILFAIVGIWYLFIDRIIERNIENTGEFFVGAKVEVANADMTFIPLGITINKLQVTDPHSPMKNIFEVDVVKFHLDGKYLFERKVIIEEMVIDGLQFNTDRAKSGEIRGGEPISIKRVYDDFILPIIDLTKLESLVDEEELDSIDRLNEVIATAVEINVDWQENYAELPTKGDVGEYKKRSEEIIIDLEQNRIQGLFTNANKIKKLKNEIEQDLETVEKIKHSILSDIDTLQTKKDYAIRSLEGDYQKLKKKYTPDIQGLRNFSEYIFKDEIIEQIDKGIYWYNKFLPIYNFGYQKIKKDYEASQPLNRTGLDFQLHEVNPKPDFLISLAKLSFAKAYQNYSGEIKNFTFQQNISSIPTTFNINGNILDFAESVQLDGSFDHINKERIKDELSVSINKSAIKNRAYPISKIWKLEINNGFIDRAIDINFENGTISGGIKFNFYNTSIRSFYNGENNQIINSIEDIFSQVSDFFLIIDIDGPIDNYQITISSDLDKIIENAVVGIAEQEAEKIINKIKTKLEEQHRDFLKQYNIQLDLLRENLTQINSINEEMNAILRILK